MLDVWLDAGIRLVQLRAKSLASSAYLDLADQCAQVCHSATATFIVNDRADIARLAGADGVHLGQSDLAPSLVRASWLRVVDPTGPGRHPSSEPMIGLSTHTLDQLRTGLAEPADYLAIGPVYPTSSKAEAERVVGVGMVASAAALMAAHGDERPLVAIGGITRATAHEVLAAGAASVAVISDLLHGDLGTNARAWLAACA